MAVFAVIYSRQLYYVKSLQVNNVFQDINGHLVSRFTRRSLLFELGFKAIQTFKNVKNTGGAGYRVQVQIQVQVQVEVGLSPLNYHNPLLVYASEDIDNKNCK